MRVRSYRPADADVLYDICLRTGDSGQDATDIYRDSRLLGEVYVGPYLRFEASLASVVEDQQGVAGYVLGALDTPAFEAECERAWWPQLRLRHPLGSHPAGSPDAHLVGLIHSPTTAASDVVSDYPSHLHIDLLPRAQGRGAGRLLMQHLFDALRLTGSPGVHLGVAADNVRAIGFYERLDFDTVQRHRHHLVMARRL